MSKEDTSSTEVLSDAPESRLQLRKKLRRRFERVHVDEEAPLGRFLHVCLDTDDGEKLLEVRLDTQSDDALLKTSEERHLNGTWTGFLNNHQCENCGTAVVAFTFQLHSPWEHEEPLKIRFRILNRSGQFEIAEVDPENRELFLIHFGWMFKA